MDFQENEMFRLVYHKYFAASSKNIVDTLTRSAKTKVSKTAALKAPTKKVEEEKFVDLETALKDKRNIEKMPNAYDPYTVEKHWYKWWKDSKFFHADAKKAGEVDHSKRFVMMIPPPNVTSYLHVGHALFVAVEDTVTRWHRMRGDVSLWLPGLDHAGIGTQSIVEKSLLKQGINKNQLGREKFLDKVWEWKEKHGGGIMTQFEKLGASVDWDRFRFTLDDSMNKGVTEAFIRLFERDLIYRSYRLVNWSCKLQTALSDIEVLYEDITEPKMIKVPGHDEPCEFGVMIDFAYKVKDSDRELIVSTTRIETMLGDVAVAVHSTDPRYQDLIGKKLIHPFIPGREMTVITDDVLVNKELGTGAVKITPAHDYNDCNCGLRNKLEFINILNNDGTINENGGPYKGMKRFDVRNKIIKDLEAKGLYRGKKTNVMRLGFCQRSGDVIEPLLRPQWYVNCQGEIRDKMINCVKAKELKIVPDIFEQDWFKWTEGLKDWCISRQLWWGHRIPAYLVTIEEKGITPQISDEKHWVAAHNEAEALEKAAKKYGVDKSKIKLQQDDDVLDTWFSSALFPFTTLGWPDMDGNEDLKNFYPGHLLETGHDILFFWVAKMVMMGYFLTDKLPFNTVFLHNLVRDKDGEKMSKSKGNVIDPIDVIDGTSLENLVDRVKQGTLPQDEMDYHCKRRAEDYPNGIPACGTDALRFSLLAYSIQARYMNMDVRRIISDRLFLNKIWNAFKFSLSQLGPKMPPKIPQDFVYDFASLNYDALPLIDKWILGRLDYCIENVCNCLENYKFGEMTLFLKDFWHYEFCDVYLEAIKPVFNKDLPEKKGTQTVLFTVFDQGLRALHPLMPFITEELYQKLPNWAQKAESISIAPYPSSNGWNTKSAQLNIDFALLNAIASSARKLASSANLPKNANPQLYILFLENTNNKDTLAKTIQDNEQLINTLGNTGKINISTKREDIPKGCVMDVSHNTAEVYLYIKDHIDIPKQIERLEKEIKNTEDQLEKLNKKMSVANYAEKVPQKVKDENSTKFNNYKTSLEKLGAELANFKKLL